MPILKIVAFLFLFLYVLPFMTVLCCMFPTFRHICFAGMLYFTSNEFSLNFVPMPDWRGTARGYAFTAVSLFAVPLMTSFFFSTKHKVSLFPPGAFFYFLYYLAVLLSGINAIHMHQWGFEVYKMFWMYITFLAAFNYLNNSRDLTYFIYLVSSLLIILFLVGVDQKYRMGVFQIRSTFPHQNSLSLYLELFGLLVLGVLLNEQISKKLLFLCLFAFGGSVLLVIFTYSRGGLVIYFGGIAIVCALSIILNGFSTRRLTLMLIGLIVMLSVVGYALPRIIQRFTKICGISQQSYPQHHFQVPGFPVCVDFRQAGAQPATGSGCDYQEFTLERYARCGSVTAADYGSRRDIRLDCEFLRAPGRRPFSGDLRPDGLRRGSGED